MCVICLSAGFAIISKQPSQLPQWNSSIAPVLALLMTAPCNRDGGDQKATVLQRFFTHRLTHTHLTTSGVHLHSLISTTIPMLPLMLTRPTFWPSHRFEKKQLDALLSGREEEKKRVLLEVRWQALKMVQEVLWEGGFAGWLFHLWSYQVVSSLKITNSSSQSFVPVDL